MTMTSLEKVKLKYPPKDRWVMRDALFAELSGGQVHSRDKTVIQSALIENGYVELAKKIADCKPSQKCLSPFCDNCQRTLFKEQKRRFKDNLIDPYDGNDKLARLNLFFVTVLHELVPFDQPDDTLIRFPTKQIKSALSKARIQLKSIRRSFDDKIKFVGAFELETVNGLLVNLHPVKGQVLADMNGLDIGLDEKLVLVHSHFIVDISGVGGEVELDQLKKKLRKIWASKKQVDVSRLYKTKPVNMSLNRLSDYPLKFPIKYYFRFNDMSDENDVVIEGKKHNLIRSHEPEVIAEMVNGVKQIGLNALYIRMGISKASSDN
jgi:hypothetical protein